MAKITKIIARQVLDSRGNPTVEAEVFTEKHSARAIVPSGASTGTHEALELRDGEKEYGGKGVKKAIENIKRIESFLKGKSVLNQREIDFLMIQLDGTDNKTELGANAILAVSMACARVAALENGQQLFEYLNNLAGDRKMCLPTPFMNIINGGLHADNALDFQEYMIVPQGKTFAESLMIGSEVYHELKKVLKKKGLSTCVGDEGGFAPNLEKYDEPIELILQAVKNLGYEKKVKIAMDVAASDFYKNKKYVVQGKELSSDELAELYKGLVKKYPIISIEDPFNEEDFEAFSKFTRDMHEKINIVGDDLLVTNVDRIKKATSVSACNALLLKVNQIGTLTEALNAAKMAFRNNWGIMVSHRSGETEDSFIADLSVALGCGMIKSGAPCRGERTAKYNQLLRIEEYLSQK
ncbi:MAG: phosphopyruvate hydratase [Nanoarchaeota archaeon]|nr:phosphopyruvate hydratase [Nanoarchaeota archaeon]MBU1270503.1 phosphopyruvate hydratase [Nanoarchaeota archaeon]MBU1603903.1 phosphopyruvate hydratase [Nanoarchaeota archaeon]MBU2442659.1 phosphopyruvate hydratase [Nanoarchaeota archaeon]